MLAQGVKNPAEYKHPIGTVDINSPRPAQRPTPLVTRPTPIVSRPTTPVVSRPTTPIVSRPPPVVLRPRPALSTPTIPLSISIPEPKTMLPKPNIPLLTPEPKVQEEYGTNGQVLEVNASLEKTLANKPKILVAKTNSCSSDGGRPAKKSLSGKKTTSKPYTASAAELQAFHNDTQLTQYVASALALTDLSSINLAEYVLKGKLYCVKKSTGTVWKYISKTKLWQEALKDDVSDMILTMVVPQLEIIINNIKTLMSQAPPDLAEQFPPLLDNVEKLKQRFETVSRCDTIARQLKVRFFDPSFLELLDSVPTRLPLRNEMVIDLPTGDLLVRGQSHFFSFECPVEYYPDATSDVLDGFLDDITCGDKDLLADLQLVLGSCLTGDVRLRQLYIFYGTGSNGKTTLMNLLESVLGPYYQTAHRSIFVEKDGTGELDKSLAALRRARVAVFNEPNFGDKLGESIIKAFTGNDTMIGRGMYENQVQFKAQFKPIILCNHKPECSNDQALWDRLVMFPFNCRYTDNPNPANPREKLKIPGFTATITKDQQVLSAFLNWLTDGAARLYEGDVPKSDAIKQATRNYHRDQDIYEQFVSETVDITGFTTDLIKMTDLYDAFTLWCKQEAITVPPAKIYKAQLASKLGEPKVHRVSAASAYPSHVGRTMRAFDKCKLSINDPMSVSDITNLSAQLGGRSIG